jgi:hypothetical protein
VSVSHFLSKFFCFLPLFQVLKCAFLIVHIFECFSIYSRSYSVCFSFSMLFSSLAILQVLQCVFLIFHVFSVSRHNSRSIVCVSHFPWFLVFSPYSRSYRVHFSISMFFSVSCHIPGPRVLCLIFHVFYFPRHNPGPTVCFSYFSWFSIFFPCSRSYSVYFSFSTFFKISRHIPG